MTIYTTLRPKYLTEYFGDAYNPETQMLKKPDQRKGWKIEMYYHQEVRDSDLFLMIPEFSQVSLVTLLKKRTLNPMYLTVYKDSTINDPFFEDVGLTCTLENFDEILPAIESSYKLVKKYTFLPNLLSHISPQTNALMNDEQKKTLEINLSSAFLNLSPANNFISVDVPLQTSTRTARGDKEQEYNIRFFTTFYKDPETRIKYYLSFTSKKLYIFNDNSKTADDSNIIKKLIENYVNALIIFSAKEENVANNIKRGHDDNFTEEKNLQNNIKINKKILKDNDIVQVSGSDNVFSMRIEIQSPHNHSCVDKFLPIPLTSGDKYDKKIYEEFYPFIKQALERKKLHLDPHDERQTHFHFALDKNNLKQDKKHDLTEYEKKEITFAKNKDAWERRNDFYTRYTLYFLSQYTQEVSSISSLEKSTLYKIIEHLQYKNRTGTTMLLNFQTYIDRPEGKYDIYKIKSLIRKEKIVIKWSSYPIKLTLKDFDYQYNVFSSRVVGKMYQLYKYVKKHKKVTDYFKKDFISDQKFKKFKNIIASNLIKDESIKDTENDSLTKEKDSVIKKLFDLNNKSCIPYELLGKVSLYKGRRFQFIDDYFSKEDPESYYHKLNKDCKEIVDYYLSLSVRNMDSTMIEEKDDVVEKFKEKSNETYLTSSIEKLEELNKVLEGIDKSTFLNKPFSVLSKSSKNTESLIEEIVLKFLQTYQNFDSSFSIKNLKILPYCQILFIYMENQLDQEFSKRLEDETEYTQEYKDAPKIEHDKKKLQEAKDFIRELLFFISSKGVPSAEKFLGSDVYYNWVKDFFLIVSSYKVINWIKDTGEIEEKEIVVGKFEEFKNGQKKTKIKTRSIKYFTELDWIELSIIMKSQEILDNYLTIKNEKGNKDIRLDQVKSKLLIECYVKSILDVYNLVHDEAGLLYSSSSLVEKLQTNYQNENDTGKDYPLFKNFLATKSSEKVMRKYLDKVVIKANSDIYFVRK